MAFFVWNIHICICMHTFAYRCGFMGKKARTTLTIDEEVLRKAKEIGLNISQFCETKLRKAIEQLSNPGVGEEKCGGRDLNPRRPTPEDLKSSPLS